jgi:adenylate cyclase
MPQPALIVILEDQEHRFPLDENNACRIGRGPNNTIALPSDGVSRNHAMVQSSDSGEFVLYDLGSRNGTFLNGRRLATPAPLQEGDLISIGSFHLTFLGDRAAGRVQDSASKETIVALSLSDVTVLAIDIRDYTGLSRKVGEQRLGEVMGEFNREAGAILNHGRAWGIKYIGDAIMSVWEHRRGEPPLLVLASAFRCLGKLEALAAKLHEQFGLADPVRIGAGLNTGQASIGNMGGGASADYTALGDVVNKAFRLESCTKEIGFPIAYSGAVQSILSGIAGAAAIASERTAHLKGYTASETVYCLDLEGLERLTTLFSATRTTLSEAIRL